jgi:hypothetical protein
MTTPLCCQLTGGNCVIVCTVARPFLDFLYSTEASRLHKEMQLKIVFQFLYLIANH